jgi:hypothetical protein
MTSPEYADRPRRTARRRANYRLTEKVFNWPGAGHIHIDSLAARDYPVLMGFTLFLAAPGQLNTFSVMIAPENSPGSSKPSRVMIGSRASGGRPHPYRLAGRTRLSGADGVYSVSGGADDSRLPFR